MNTQSKKAKVEKKKRIEGFQVLEDECIWMKAGVVNYRQCDNDYDCNSCPFDKGMRKAMGVGQDQETTAVAPQWVTLLQEKYDGSSRPCRHALTGRIDAPKICTQSYECYHCSFDQMLDDMDLVREVDPPVYRLVSGYKMAEGYYYHMGHSWARFEHGGRVKVGLDDFTVKVFGTAKTLTLPPLGEVLKQNQVGWTFSRNGYDAAVLAPITGTVLAVNQNARKHPEIIAEDPFHEGWLFMMEPDMPKRNLRGLYFDKESHVWMENEVQALLGLMGPEYEQMAATGGEPLQDLFGHFPNIGWGVLVKRFLRSEKKAHP
jgi:glycine cleavage system H lipoate-binding protein